MASLELNPELWRLWHLARAVATTPGPIHMLRGREAPRGNIRDMQLHHVPTVVVCLEGVIRIITAKSHIDLTPGEVLIIAPAAWHTHAPLRPGSAGLGLGLTPGARSDVVLYHAANWHGFTVPDARMRGLLYALLAAQKSELKELARQALGEALDHRGEHRVMPEPVSRMAVTLWWQLTGRLSARNILQASGLSHRQAHRLFVQQFGTTPQQALRQCRLDLANSLVSEGCSPTEAAARSGFLNRADLIRTQRRLGAAVN